MSERSEASKIGAKLQKNSGRGKIQKGDAIWHNFTLDFKEYEKSFTINQDMWSKVVTDAMKNGNDPALFLVLGTGNRKIRLAVIEASMLEQLVENNGTD